MHNTRSDPTNDPHAGELVELWNQPEKQLMARLHGLGNAGSRHATPLFKQPSDISPPELNPKGQRAKGTGLRNVLGKTEAHEVAPGADVARVLV